VGRTGLFKSCGLDPHGLGWFHVGIEWALKLYINFRPK
jgi:hypothetical protein